MMKKLLLPAAMLALMITGCSRPTAENGTAKPAEEKTEETSEEKEAADTQLLSGMHHAEITIRDYGVIKVELDADEAPITVTNFVELAQSGFYDGLTFHRIMNGVENNISHTEGVISMARAQNPDSATSQFFITVADAVYLDSAYAAFGHVTEGLDIAKKIAADARPTDANGTIRPEEQPVIESIVIID